MNKNDLLLFKNDNVGFASVVSFSASEHTTWYVNSRGELYGCGRNDCGQQGSGTTTNVGEFTKRADNVAKVKATNTTTWYLTNDGELYGCGLNSNGQQGSGDTENVLTFTKRATEVDMFDASEKTTIFSKGLDVYLCGAGNRGQQANGSTNDVKNFTKRDTSPSTILKVIALDEISIYVYLSGDSYFYPRVCGANSYSQLGIYNTTDQKIFKTGNRYIFQSLSYDVELKRYFSVSNFTQSGRSVVYPSKFLICGRNDYGQKFLGNTESSTSASTIQTVNVYLADFSSFRLDTSYTDGGVYAVGRNNYGQLGTGTTDNTVEGVRVFEGTTTVDTMVIPTNSTTWLLNMGTLYGCGRNDRGQQGSGGTDNVLSFVQRASAVADVKATELTTWYINSRGELLGCGDNTYGQQGGGGSYVSTFTKRS